MKTILLDTNAYSLYLKGDQKVKKVVMNANVLYLSSISIGELHAGFSKGDRFDSNELLLNKFLLNGRVKVSNVNLTVAKIYGQIYFYLRQKGLLIPTNDVWIAACAIETDSTLVTYDKHFLSIPNLKLWNNIK